MKATYLSLTLALLTLAFFTSCGPDANKPNTEVTALTLTPTTATLQPEETLELTATVTPADAKVTFSTNNAAVATVCKKGVVKAIAPGTATITAKAGDKTATCTVTVEEKKVEEKNVSLFNKIDGKKYPSGSTIDYVTTVSQEDADFYQLGLLFSVLRTAKYTAKLTFDQAITGSVCIGICKPVKNETSYITAPTIFPADNVETDEKGVGEMYDPTIHLKLPTAAGETYKNRMIVELTPEDGGETLTWTVNFAITVK